MTYKKWLFIIAGKHYFVPIQEGEVYEYIENFIKVIDYKNEDILLYSCFPDEAYEFQKIIRY